MHSYNNNPKLREHSQNLRQKMTKEELHLWLDFLKKLNLVVHRQKVIDNYIVDFCIPSEKLVIELDGSQHYEPESREYDKKRDDLLRSQGYTVLRYLNSDVNNYFDAVCADILKHIKSASSVSLRLPPGLAAARSRSGSDSRLGCHSIPSRRFATL